MPIVGKDWAHKGVVQLYNNIYNNGYKILYLTARAIGYNKIILILIEDNQNRLEIF